MIHTFTDVELAAHDAEKRAEWEAEQEDLDNCCDVRGGQDRCGDCPKDRGRTEQFC